MMSLSYLNNNRNLGYHISLILILVANTCFYTIDHIQTYEIVCIVGILISIFTCLQKKEVHFLADRGVGYLTVLYFMYTFYGLFFLRKNTYNWDMLLFTYVQNVCIYIVIRSYLKTGNLIKELSVPVIISLLYIMFYMYIENQEMILVAQVETRIGDTMSGNVNSVGRSLGILSFVLTLLYCKYKNPYIFAIVVPLVVLMLLTGSKKVIIILVLDILTIYVYSRAKVGGFIKVGLLLAVLFWLVMDNSYFYEVIGKRVEDMFSTFTGSGSGDYSHSTDDREGMLKEAFSLAWDYPLFGGGMNYYSYASKMYGDYGYSHCNYTEMLCNFGLFGFLIYYLPYFSHVRFFWKKRKANWSTFVFATMWLVMALFLGWAMVAFSGICINYLPIITSFAMIADMKERNKHVKTYNLKKALVKQ